MPSRSTGVTVTFSGWPTNPLTTYSKNACMTPKKLCGRGGVRGGFRGLLDEGGNGVARLRALADPVLRALQIEREIVVLLHRRVRADFLDELAIARAAAIRDHDAVNRRVF